MNTGHIALRLSCDGAWARTAGHRKTSAKLLVSLQILFGANLLLSFFSILGTAHLVTMVGYGEAHKLLLRKEWEAYYVDYDVLQRMLQQYLDCPGQRFDSVGLN